MLEQLINLLQASKYFLLFAGSIFEGPVLMLTSGFFIRTGQLSVLPTYLLLMAGDFTADLVWYAVGRHGAGPLMRYVGKFFNITPEIIAKIEKRFHTYHARILFISKITMGFGFALATLIVAGMLRVPLKKYAALNLAGGFIWTALLLTLGFFFGNIYTLVAKPFRIAFIVGLILMILIALYTINRYLVKKEI